MDRLLGGKAVIALLFKGDVDEHDAVLLHDADKKDNADNADHIERSADQHERDERRV